MRQPHLAHARARRKYATSAIQGLMYTCRFIQGFFREGGNVDTCSGGFRNLERGVQLLVREARPKIFGSPRPLPVTLAVPIEYLEATLGLVKRLEISKDLIRERVTVPGCCCCIIF